MKFNSLKEVLSYIENKTNFQLGLLRVQAFLKKAQISYEDLKYIHIGGTNGKGSTAYYLSNILIESGYKTGMFSSPSIESHNDRIRINNEFIDDNSIVQFVNEYYDIIEETEVTMFEIDVLMALDYFAKNKIDYVVMEVGMGGRFDGTNIIDPIISVITNIGLDHLAYLGDNKQEIAYNKAGIIKENGIIITGEKDMECLKTIKDYAQEMQASVIETGLAQVKTVTPIVFDYKGYENIQLKTPADYQVKNAVMVLEVIEVLNSKFHLNIELPTIKKVFNEVTWNGRFEVISHKPFVVIDGAHNVEGIKELVQSLEKYSLFYQKTIMFAALEDKSTDEMVQLLVDSKNEVVISEFEFYRTKKANAINENFALEVASDFREYLQHKIEKMEENEMLVVTGSLYFITEVRKFLLDTLKLNRKRL